MGKLKDWNRLDRHITDCATPNPIEIDPWIDSIDPNMAIDPELNQLSTMEIGRQLSVLRSKYLRTDRTLRSIRSFKSQAVVNADLQILAQLEILFKARVQDSNTKYQDSNTKYQDPNTQHQTHDPNSDSSST